jgi:hypothetical protein
MRFNKAELKNKSRVGVGVGFVKIGVELHGVGAVIDGVGVGVGVEFLKIGVELPGVGAVHTRSCPTLLSRRYKVIFHPIFLILHDIFAEK